MCGTEAGSWNLQVAAINGGDRIVWRSATTVLIDASPSFDPDGDAIEWEWTCASGKAISELQPCRLAGRFSPTQAVSRLRSLLVRD